MEILIGVISTGIVEIIKILSKKFGKEMSKRIVHGTVAVIVLIGAYLMSENILTREMIKHYMLIFSSAYTMYRLVIKPVKNKLNI